MKWLLILVLGILLILFACILVAFMMLIWLNIVDMQLNNAYPTAQEAFDDVFHNGVATLTLIGLGLIGLVLAGLGRGRYSHIRKGEK
jgi:uncharacterized membrane protein